MLIPKLVTCLKTYDRRQFLNDLFAGVTVGVVALPLGMAFAIASGLPPERGLFTAMVAGFLISALGGSRVQIGGPTGAFVVIVAGVATKFGYAGLVWSMVLAGGFLIALGAFRMGGLIKFIPFPVTTGFTSGIAVVILSTQVKDFLGLRMGPLPAEFLAQWAAYGKFLGTLNPAAVGVGLLTIGLMAGIRKAVPRAPAMLLAMVGATVLAAALGLPVETIGDRFGELPRHLPSPSLPPLDLAALPSLIGPAFTIGLLAAIESLLSATVADGMMGGRHRPNMELVAQGIANIASSCFGGIPATGAIARTAANVRSGGRTPVAGMVHSVTLGLILLFFAPWAGKVPLAVLAGLLMVVGYNMSELRNFRRLLRAPRSDVMVLLSTFGLTVLVDLTVAVEVGIVLSALLFIRRMSEVSNVSMITRELGEDRDEPEDPNAVRFRSVPEGVQVFEVQGPFFFGAADRFKEAVRVTGKSDTIFILRLRQVPAMDATGLHVLGELHRDLKARGIALVLSGVHAQPLMAMRKLGLWEEIGEENIFGNIDDALNRARRLLDLPEAPRPGPFVPTVRRERPGDEKPEEK